MGHYTQEITRNAERIRLLKKRIDETFKFHDKNEHRKKEWQKACVEFHTQYDALAFPGGYSGALQRILDGDSKAIEAAICFLECRPYFFRSGYMFKDIMRKVKKAPLAEDQKARLRTVQNAYDTYRRSRKH